MPGGDVVSSGNRYPGVRPPPPPPRSNPSPGGDVVSSGRRYPGVSGRSSYTPPRAPVHSDVSSSPPHWQAQVNQFKQTPQYRQAVAQVFAAQATRQKALIIRGLSRSNAWNTPEYHATRDVWDHLAIPERDAISRLVPKDVSRFITGSEKGPDLGGFVKNVGGELFKLTNPNDFRAVASGSTPEGQKVLAAGASGIGKAIQSIPTGIGMPTEQRGIAQQAGLGPGQLAKNLGKDVVNTAAEAGPSLSIPIAQAVQGHWKQAAQAFTQPYADALGHGSKGFLQFVSQHPGDAYLMFSPGLHVAARVAEAGGRRAFGKGPVDLTQPSVSLTANLTHERPHQSPFPLIRQAQGTVAKQLYKKTPEGSLTPKSEGVNNRLIKLETSRLVGQNERVRRLRVEEQRNAHTRSVLISKPARAARAVTTALKYDPGHPLIPGANVLKLIANGTVRRPETLVEDLNKYLRKVASGRPDLEGMPRALAEHDANVKELKAALADKRFLKNPGPAFRAAEQYGKDYPRLQKNAQELGHYRDMTQDALDRRAYAPAVLSHMEGAHFDPERGLMVNGRQLSTEEMRQFVQKETAGRPVAYTSDRPKQGDRAFFVNGRPLPIRNARNTYFAHSHGLGDLSHEALLENRVRLAGIVHGHRAMNRLADQLLLQNEKTGSTKAWASYEAAKRDAPEGYVPIRLSHTFHPSESLKKALEAGKVNMAALEEEATRRELDINSRLHPSSEPGTWGLIHQAAAEQLQAHENQISPGAFMRGARAFTGQWRRVALGTSFKHLPGVLQEQLIRAAASGIGPVSWFAGRAALKRATELDKTLGEERRVHLAGGMQAGQALSLQTRQVSRHFSGSLAEAPLKAFEGLMKAPVARQFGTAWRYWLKFTINGTKKFLEENSQTAGLGKTIIRDFGSNHGVLAKAMGTWGEMVDKAAHGILDESTARRFRVEINRVYGRWTDLTPGEQQALMFSPFGMWWTNSVAFLSRFPIDHPILGAVLGAATVGTEKERQALGLDMFAPGHLPLYKQGSIPVGGDKLWQAIYYSPAGVINNPQETGASLLFPWVTNVLAAGFGSNPFFREMNSPQNPRGGPVNEGTKAAVVLNSLLASLVPFYSKAQTVVTGGASQYDTSTLFRPQTKGKNPGFAAGVKKAVTPFRLTKATAASSAGGGGWGGGSSSPTGGSSGGGWGGGGSSTGGGGTGGWG